MTPPRIMQEVSITYEKSGRARLLFVFNALAHSQSEGAPSDCTCAAGCWLLFALSNNRLSKDAITSF